MALALLRSSMSSAPFERLVTLFRRWNVGQLFFSHSAPQFYCTCESGKGVVEGVATAADEFLSLTTSELARYLGT